MSQPPGGPPLSEPRYEPAGQVPGWQPRQAYPAPHAYPASPPYPYPGPIQPAGPRRSNTVVLLLVLGIVVALALFAGIATTAVVVSRNQAATADGTPASPGGRAHPGDLRTYLAAAPADAQPWSHPLGTDEHLSLGQDASLAEDAAAMAAELRRYKFQEGAVRTWRTADATLVEIRLLRFDNGADAEGFYQADSGSTVAQYDPGAVSSVDGVAEAVVIADSTTDRYGYVHLLGLARKDDVVFVVLVGLQGTLVWPPGLTLVRQQYDRL